MGRGIQFKPTTFYLGIADHLAKVAEAEPQVEERAQEEQEDDERAEMAESLSKGEHADRQRKKKPPSGLKPQDDRHVRGQGQIESRARNYEGLR